MIEVLHGFPDQVAAYACSGHLTTADYKKILADVEDRYTRHKKLRCYTEVANDFNGLDPGALWEDAKLCFAHMFDWDRFAVVTDVEWISRTTKFMAIFMPLEGRVYPMADAAKAREWIGEPDDLGRQRSLDVVGLRGAQSIAWLRHWHGGVFQPGQRLPQRDQRLRTWGLRSLLPRGTGCRMETMRVPLDRNDHKRSDA